MSVMQWIEQHENDIIETYKYLHTIPELAHQEFKTAAFIAEELRKAGLEVEEKAEGTTGIIATMRGKEPGPVVGLRADMDALPMQEETGLPFASTHPGVMHSCGHDAHSTIVLWTAKALAANGGIKRGTVKFVFQPAEEIISGARKLLATGKLDDIEDFFSLHLRPRSEAKFGEASVGISHSGCCPVKIRLEGKSSHGARPHQGINVAEVAGLISHAVGLVHCDPRVTHSAKCTHIHVDTGTHNIIPDKGTMYFDLRSQTNEVMDDQIEKVVRAIKGCAEAMDAKVEIEMNRCPAAQLDPDLMEEARVAITSVLGSALPAVEVPASEDFHVFAVEGGKRTTLIGIGTDCETHHNPKVVYNLGASPLGVKIMTTLLVNKLGN